MYFWNVGKLVDEIQNETLSEKEKFKYYLSINLITTILTSGVGASLLLNEKMALLSTFCDIFNVLIFLFGTYYLYKLNADRGSFLERMVCIGWPVGFKVLIVSLLFYFILLILVDVVATANTSAYFSDILGNVGGLLTEMFIFWRLRHWFIVLNSIQPSVPTTLS